MEDKVKGMGWLPDYPDYRDYTTEKALSPTKPEHEEVKSMLTKLRLLKQTEKGDLEPEINLRKYCSPVEDQETLGSCTAHAGVGLIEYYEKRSFNKHIDASRLFIYKVTRNLLRLVGDTGAFIRTTMGAMRLFGVPPERYWHYNIEEFDLEPPAFCYSFAQDYKSLRYLRLDPPGMSLKELLDEIKTKLAAGIPSMFGFTVYDSIRYVGSDGKIPYPLIGEKILGGHAVVAVGYNNDVEIKCTDGETKTVGALWIRNSWGEEWGRWWLWVVAI